jgi:hypothetical protein
MGMVAHVYAGEEAGLGDAEEEARCDQATAVVAEAHLGALARYLYGRRGWALTVVIQMPQKVIIKGRKTEGRKRLSKTLVSGSSSE